MGRPVAHVHGIRRLAKADRSNRVRGFVRMKDRCPCSEEEKEEGRGEKTAS